ncbi:4481_t:CDS:2, partial [Gigaspora margarita]
MFQKHHCVQTNPARRSDKKLQQETPKWMAPTTKKAPKWTILVIKDTEIDNNRTLKKKELIKLTSNTSEVIALAKQSHNTYQQKTTTSKSKTAQICKSKK